MEGHVCGLSRFHLPEAARLVQQITDGKTIAELQESLRAMWSRWRPLQLGAIDVGGNLLGVVTGAIDDQDQAVGWSHDIAVEPHWRAKGLGSRLLGRQLDAFREAGCRVVRGQSPARLYPALPFLHRHGFRIVERTLSRGHWGIADGQELCITQVEL